VIKCKLNNELIPLQVLWELVQIFNGIIQIFNGIILLKKKKGLVLILRPNLIKSCTDNLVTLLSAHDDFQP
jgi:hypothetical protein